MTIIEIEQPTSTLTISVCIPTLNRNSLSDTELSILNQKIQPNQILFDESKPFNIAITNLFNKTTSDIIAVIDDDITIAPDYLSNIMKAFDDTNVGFVGGNCLPKINVGASTKNINFQKIVLNVEQSDYAFGIMSNRYKTHLQDNNADETTLIGVGAFRKSLVQEYLKTHTLPKSAWENILITYIRKSGYKTIYDPNCNFYHAPRNNIISYIKQIGYYGKGRVQYFRRFKSQLIRKPYFTFPSLLVVSLLLAPVWPFWLIDLAYFISIMVLSGFNIPQAILTMITHISYGLGFLYGLIRCIK